MFSFVKQVAVSVAVGVITAVAITAVVDPDGFDKLKSRWIK